MRILAGFRERAPFQIRQVESVVENMKQPTTPQLENAIRCALKGLSEVMYGMVELQDMKNQSKVDAAQGLIKFAADHLRHQREFSSEKPLQSIMTVVHSFCQGFLDNEDYDYLVRDTHASNGPEGIKPDHVWVLKDTASAIAGAQVYPVNVTLMEELKRLHEHTTEKALVQMWDRLLVANRHNPKVVAFGNITNGLSVCWYFREQNKLFKSETLPLYNWNGRTDSHDGLELYVRVLCTRATRRGFCQVRPIQVKVSGAELRFKPLSHISARQ